MYSRCRRAKRGKIPISRGLYSNNRKQTGCNSNIKKVMFQHQGDKRGSIPKSRGLYSSIRGIKGVQFQFQEGYIPASGGQKGLNCNIKRVSSSSNLYFARVIPSIQTVLLSIGALEFKNLQYTFKNLLQPIYKKQGTFTNI